MSRINRVPFGLQDLLGSQNFGDNPSELSSVVAPVLDMLPFLSAERYSYSYQSGNISNNGAMASGISVPDGEIWYVTGVGFGIKPNSGLPGGAYGISISAVASKLPTSTSPSGFHAVGNHYFRYATPQPLTNENYDFAAYDYPFYLPLVAGSSIQFYAAGMYGDNNWAFRNSIRYVKANQ